MRFCHERGMTHYIYAPKDDPLHREHWRTPYPPEQLEGFGRLLAEETLQVGFAISPGLSIDYDDVEDRDALVAKCDQVVEVGVQLICLALDDIPIRPGLGEDQVRLTRFLRDHLGDRAGLVLVPTHYTGTSPNPYLAALAEGTPEDVPIAWTGRTVVCDSITAREASERAQALGGRPPLVWDNYPVNDALMADQLFMGPLRGRDPDLSVACSGYLANPMVQARCSLLPLASIAGYLRGEDPAEVWLSEAEELGIRVFAEACDGQWPLQLVRALAAEGLAATGSAEAVARVRQWFEAAARCEVAGLGQEADQWVEQIHLEAGAALVAVEVLERIMGCASTSRVGALGGATELALMGAALWQQLPRACVTVMGPRRGFRPVISQSADGGWQVHAAALQDGENAVDTLLAWAFEQLEAAESAG